MTIIDRANAKTKFRKLICKRCGCSYRAVGTGKYCYGCLNKKILETKQRWKQKK